MNLLMELLTELLINLLMELLTELLMESLLSIIIITDFSKMSRKLSIFAFTFLIHLYVISFTQKKAIKKHSDPFWPEALARVWVCAVFWGRDCGGIRGRSRRPGSFVSPGERIGRLSSRLGKLKSRVQDDRRTSRPTGKSL